MNGVVFADEGVSWQHAQLWVEGPQPWVRDLGSRNGTHVNGVRINGSHRLSAGDVVVVGTKELKVRPVGHTIEAVFRTRHVEDPASGVRLMVRRNRFLIGGDAGSDLRVEGLPDRAAMLVFHDNGEIWLGTADAEEPIEAGKDFTVHGRVLRVVEESLDHAPTVEYGTVRYAYGLRVSGDGPSGPQAVLTEGPRELLLTGNRGILLFVLARQLVKDREAGTSPTEAGWINTDDVTVAVWGRGTKGPNHLNVLVHRLREHLQEEKFDPWFVEKRRGAIRITVKDVVMS
jgi:pSer/pThr/pTyr-binding forkhead associated (FHA) protein